MPPRFSPVGGSDAGEVRFGKRAEIPSTPPPPPAQAVRRATSLQVYSTHQYSSWELVVEWSSSGGLSVGPRCQRGVQGVVLCAIHGPIPQAGKQQGLWVLLQNCHLYADWMGALEKTVEDYSRDENRASLNKEFRLWLTAMPSTTFPVSILQVCVAHCHPEGRRSGVCVCLLGCVGFASLYSVPPNRPWIGMRVASPSVDAEQFHGHPGSRSCCSRTSIILKYCVGALECAMGNCRAKADGHMAAFFRSKCFDDTDP